jgi:hypothetical protein
MSLSQDNYPVPLGLIVQHWHNTFVACDGLMAVTASTFEKGSIDAWRIWLNSSGKDLYTVGPLESVAAQEGLLPAAKQYGSSQQDADVLNFLDRMLEKHGSRSVIYVCSPTLAEATFRLMKFRIVGLRHSFLPKRSHQTVCFHR